MSYALLFWILMLLWLVVLFVGRWPAAPPDATLTRRAFVPFGDGLLLWVLVALLGSRVFGAPLHP